MMIKAFLTFVVIVSAIALPGCSRRSAAESQSAMALRAALESQENTLTLLGKLSQKANEADSSQRIKPETNEALQSYLGEERKNVESIRKQLLAAQADMERGSRSKSARERSQIMERANRTVQESIEVLRILEKKTEVIVDFLGSETFSKSEIGTLFRPGEYRLVKEQVSGGKKLFAPIVHKLFQFAKKHKAAFSNMTGEIIVTGYSDGTPVEKGSALYKDLARMLRESEGLGDPTPQDLNRKLSELRASAVKELLTAIISESRKHYDNPIDISVQILGRGEETPPGLEGELAENDRRRRVVTFYWVVLPTL